MSEATQKKIETPQVVRWPTAARPLREDAIDQAQRERIVAATIDLVAKRGYKGTSAERICKEANVGYPTFRKFYRDKEEAFGAAYEESVAEVVAEVRSAADASGGDWAAQVAAGLGALLRAISEEPRRARICLVEVLTAGARGIESYDASVEVCVGALRAGRERGRLEGELPPLLEEAICSGVVWSIHQLVAEGRAAQAPEMFAALAETLLSPYVEKARIEELIAEERAKR